MGFVSRTTTTTTSTDSMGIWYGGSYAVSFVILIVAAITSGWSLLGFIAIPFLAIPLSVVVLMFVVALMNAGAVAIIVAVVGGIICFGVYTVFIIIPSIYKIQAGGFSEILAYVFGLSSALMNSSPFLTNVLLSGTSGMLVGVAVGLWKGYISRSKLGQTALKALFSKEVLTANTNGFATLLLSTTVGFFVGALGGASGILGMFSSSSALTQTPHDFVLFNQSVIAELITGGGGGSGPEGPILLLVITLVIVIFFSSVLSGVFSGAFFGFIKGSIYGAFSASVDKTAKASERWRETWEGATNGCFCGAVVGLIHGAITTVAACMN